MSLVSTFSIRPGSPHAPATHVAAPDPPPAPEVFLGSYGLLREIGRGGMGVVYEAVDLLGRRFALKWAHPELVSRNPCMRERFRREAVHLAGVSHPNVVPLLQYYEQDAFAWIVMPLLRGETLASLLEWEGARPLPDLLQIGRQAAEGLHALHQNGLVHRDIKPGNLFRKEDGTVVVMDLGISFRRDDPRLTGAHCAIGTPGYTSPERLLGARGEASGDVYSLGIVLWQLATGVRSLLDDRTGSVLPAYLRDQTSWTLRRPSALRPGLPPAIDNLLLAMMAFAPRDRPTMREVADALGLLL
jgi:serine/threonine-protein kinase